MPVAVAISVEVGYSSVLTELVVVDAAAEVEVPALHEAVTVANTVSPIVETCVTVFVTVTVLAGG